MDNIKVKDDFNYNSLNYYPFLEVQEMFKQYILSDSNILLLAGTPGTGKTKLGDAFMQYLLNTLEIKTKDVELYVDDKEKIIIEETMGVKVAYVKNEEILADDLFWNNLREEEYNLVFLDDLDYSLLPRAQEITTSEDIQKNKFISNLLSFTDGIFESGNKTKFIITTNRGVNNIDSAALRKGRTFDILELRKLHNDEAKNIWRDSGLNEEKFIEEFNTGEVLQGDLGATINMELKDKEKNIELKPYILEEGISLYNKIKNPKRMGI